MATEASFNEVASALTAGGTVVLCAHVNPDGDAIGSALALALALRKLGVDAVPTLADPLPVPVTYAFLPGSEIFRPVTGLEPPAVFVALDTPNPSRLGPAAKLAEKAGLVIVIDHHPDNRCFGALNLVDATAASTSQLVWRLLPALGVEADSAIATCVYTAMVTDTGRFQYTNATAQTHRDAADMIDVGVDVSGVYGAVYETRSPGALALVARVLDRIRVVNAGRIAYSWVNDEDFAETGALHEEGENLIDGVRTLRDIQVAVLIKETADGSRVNLRAKGDADVGGVARTFGGGGHRAAAGFSFAGTMEELLPRLLAELPGA